METGGERRLIVNCDDFGSTLCANDGVEMALTAGIATSATVMVPCPWAFDAIGRAALHPQWAVGVHLTHTAEWPRYRWRAILPRERVPGLHGSDGFLWPRVGDVAAHATADEVFAEAVAQVEQAIAWGLRPTHVDTHMGALHARADFHEAYLAVAERFRLPLRLPGERDLQAAATSWAPWAGETRDNARRRGLRFPDDLLHDSRRLPGEDAHAFLSRLLGTLLPGTTEVLFHPAVDTPELHAMTGRGDDRVADLRLLTSEFARQMLSDQGVRLVNYRDLG